VDKQATRQAAIESRRAALKKQLQHRPHGDRKSPPYGAVLAEGSFNLPEIFETKACENFAPPITQNSCDQAIFAEKHYSSGVASGSAGVSGVVSAGGVAGVVGVSAGGAQPTNKAATTNTEKKRNILKSP